MFDKSSFKNVFSYAAGCQDWFNTRMAEVGYEPKTTYYGDFSIAEWVSGTQGIRDTYERAINEHKDNAEWLTEICLCINHKSWQFVQCKNTKDEELSKFYSDLYYECVEKLTGYCDDDGNDHDGLLDKDGLDYFYRVTD